MAINDISLTSGMRTNLVSLQTTTELLNRTQDRLSSGKKVNTALDNALNFFTAKALNTRADELAGYKDGMSEAVQTINAANAGISAIEGLIGQAKAVAATAKAGGTTGVGAVSNITVDLVGITAGQTINVGEINFTAVGTDGHLQKTIDFTGIAVNDKITIGSTEYTAVGAHDTLTFGTGLSVGQTIVIGEATYTAVGTHASISFAGIAVNDTIAVGSTTYTAVAKYKSITAGAAGEIAVGDSITIGSTTFVATGAAATGTDIPGIVYFSAAGTGGADLVALAAKIQAEGLGATTADFSTGVLTLAATMAFSISEDITDATVTLDVNTVTATTFIITTGDTTTNASTFLTMANLNEGASIGTASNGVITLTGNTRAGTVDYTNTGGGTASIGHHTLGVNEFTITYGATTANADAFVTRVAALTSTTIGTLDNGVITLTGNTRAGTVETTSVTLGHTAGTGNQYVITIGADEANAAAFLTKAGTTIGATATGSSDVILTFDTSALAVTKSDTATIAIADATVALAATEFYIGVGSTTLGITNNMSAANLAAKLNNSSGGDYIASVSANRINIIAGTSVLTDAGTPLVLTLDDTVSSAATSATAGFTIEYNKSTVERSTYAEQYNTIMAQLDLLATDSSYKGINFLEKDSTLDVIFGTLTSDKITLIGFDASAKALLAKTDINFEDSATNTWATNDDVNVDIEALARATATLKAQASSMSSGLSIINTRQDFVKAMVNTVTQGADNLTLADMNEEGANMLMLQTRQSLSTTALSMSAQAAQSVLRLFA